jgi:hypothetical protein
MQCMAVVNAEIDIGALPAKEQLVIAEIQQRNTDIANGTIKIERNEWGVAASLGFFGIRSSHGIGLLDITTRNMRLVTVYPKRGTIGDLYVRESLTRKKVKLCWLEYAESSATEHAHGGIPTLVEFSGSSGGRIILEYARDLIIYTPDHYGTYYLVTAHGEPVRTIP